MLGLSPIHGLRNQLVRLAASRDIRPAESVANEILLIRPDHPGDLLLLQPAIKWLKPYVDRDRLVLMVGPWSAEVARHALPVDEVVVCRFPGFERSHRRAPLEPYRLLARTAEQIRERAPRAAVILRDDHWWGAWMAKEAGIPARFGHDHTIVKPHLTRASQVTARHWVARNAELLSFVLRDLGYQIPTSTSVRGHLALDWPEDLRAAESISDLLAATCARPRYAVIHPGSGAQVKNWPTERWAAVAGALSREFDLDVIITGGPSERALTSELARATIDGAINLSGKTSILELGELYRRAAIVLGVDSGPLHLAAATGAPTVHLFGPSDVFAFGPWGEPDRNIIVRAGLTCPRCGDLSPQRPEGCGCMVGISVERVVDAARRVLRDG